MIDSCKSSKLGNIIYFIKHSLDINDKVIIFSQWDIILDKIERVLQHFNLKHVYCTGTVYNKKRMIKQFTKGDSNIILLSSKNSASGINLTEANKIILVEPVYGSNEYRFNIESQAIGRADRIGQAKPIDIYRFIVKDTIEEKIYNGCEDYNINTN
jgi:SNF2 family DNA or RNA helicase